MSGLMFSGQLEEKTYRFAVCKIEPERKEFGD